MNWCGSLSILLSSFLCPFFLCSRLKAINLYFTIDMQWEFCFYCQLSVSDHNSQIISIIIISIIRLSCIFVYVKPQSMVIALYKDQSYQSKRWKSYICYPQVLGKWLFEYSYTWTLKSIFCCYSFLEYVWGGSINITWFNWNTWV